MPEPTLRYESYLDFSSAKTTVVLDPSDAANEASEADSELSEFDRFNQLAGALVQVPKSEIDEQRAKA